MNKQTLTNSGYKKYNQPTGEPTLYQKRISDKNGTKYFINCYHYIFPERSQTKDAWEFKIQTESNYGTVNTTLFNTDKTINQIETFMECIWIHYGAKYYERFANQKSSEGVK